MMNRRLRFRRFLRLALSWGLLFALCLACTAEEGERSTSGDCPEGETCSDATPSGLVFYGPWPTEDGGSTTFLPRIALGGSQNISYAAREGETLGEARADSSAPWIVQVDPADPDRDAHALWSSSDDVRLSGLAEGTAYLRVIDPSTEALYDRVELTVQRVRNVDVVGGDGVAPASVVAGERTSLVFRLLGGDGGRLVDEGMTIESETPFERATWDSIHLDVPIDADEVVFTLDAGHRRWAVTVPVSR